MIKRLLTIILVSIVFSQIVSSQNLRFSFLLNPQFAWLQGGNSSYETSGSLLKINTGVEMDYFFTENYAFSTGLTLNTLGGTANFQDSIYLTSDDVEILLEPGNNMDYSLQYIGIPLGLKFKTVEIGYTTIWVNTGVSPMFRINAKGTDSSGTFDRTDISDEINLFNFQYFIEAGVEYSIGGNTAIVGGLGYNSGIMDVTTRSTEKLATQAFSIIIGILF